MIYSQGKKAGGQKQKRTVRFLVVGLGLVAAIGGILIALDIADALPFGIHGRDRELLSLWNESKYDEVQSAAEAILNERPLNGEALTFAGFAYFYRGVEAVDESERLEQLDRAIVALRKALHVPRAPLAAERDYVLAKAYYHKGDEYIDLAARYMVRSLERGHEAPDSRTYLGLSYARLDDFETSVRWFEEAIVHARPEERNAVRIRAAESYVALGDYSSAREMLELAVSGLDDEFLILMARNELASVLIQAEKWDEAEVLLEETIERFPQSADAYYYLGVVYDETDRGVEARGLWRTAREIDPNHTEALRRLANWGA